MTAIKGLFEEVRFELLKVSLLNSFLDATILFLALFLILSVFSIGVFIPLFIALLFFAYMVWDETRKVSLKYIEERNPNVREMLRTAADNQDDDDLMAQALFSDVIKEMRRVSGGSLVDMRTFGIKICGVFLLSLVIVSLAFFNINIQKFDNPLVGIEGRLKGFLPFLGDVNETDPGLSGLDDDLFGEPRLAQLGDEALDINLEQSLNQVDFNKVHESDPSSDIPESYPGEVDAQASEAYTGGLEDVNDRKTAADYSQQIKR